jgi:hypothetical protein
MNELIPVADVERMATAIAKSGLFGVKEPNQALALMLLAQAEGMHPATAARDFHIINGRPSMKAETMLARFQSDGGTVHWEELSDTCARARFAHPATPDGVVIEWTLETAKRAELLKNAMWAKYPRAMLRSRCISEGVRTVRPAVLLGMYTPEEIKTIPPEEREVAGEAEVARNEPPPPPPPEEYDYEAAEAKINGFADVVQLRAWLAGERQRRNWTPQSPPYLILCELCKERAEALKNPPPPVDPLTAEPEIPQARPEEAA